MSRPAPSKADAAEALALAASGRDAAIARQAESAVLAGDAGALEAAWALGWHPSMGRGWFELAMREPSGASLGWMMSRHPLAAARDKLFSEPQGHAKWALAPMLIAEDLAFAKGGRQAWAAACSASVQAGAYFEATLRDNPAWIPPPGWAPERAMAALDDWLIPLRSQNVGAESSKNCARMAMAEAALLLARVAGLQGEAQARRNWEEYVALLAMGLLRDKRPLASVDALLDALPEAMTRMGASWIQLPRASHGAEGHARQRKLGDLLRAWTGKCGGGAPALSSACDGLGFRALMGADLGNLDYAIAKGWVGHFQAREAGFVEHPGKIARDHAREWRPGSKKPWEGQPRWAKCVASLMASDLPPARRDGYLALCESPDPGAWSEGDPALIGVGLRRKASPVSALLCAHGDLVWGASLKTAVRMLSKAGFTLSEAISADDGLGAQARAAAGDPWAKRLLEEEALRAACVSDGEPSGPKGPRL